MREEIARLREMIEAKGRWPSQLRTKLWVLTGAIALVGSGALYLEAAWRQGVNRAIDQVPLLAAKVDVDAARLDQLTRESLEQRKETIQFYAFVYQKMGYVDGAKSMGDALERLAALEARLSRATPPQTPARP